MQKDFATALRALRELLGRGHVVTLVLTLDQAEPGIAAVMAPNRGTRRRGNVENRGELGVENVSSRSMTVLTRLCSRRCASPSAFHWSKRWQGVCRSSSRARQAMSRSPVQARWLFHQKIGGPWPTRSNP